MSDKKSITVVLTIHPPKAKGRRVDVAAAPEGGLPLILTGQFAERHALVDRAYLDALKRDAKRQAKAAANGKVKPQRRAKTKSGPIGPVEEEAPEGLIKTLSGDYVEAAAMEEIAENEAEPEPDTSDLPVIEDAGEPAKVQGEFFPETDNG